MGIPPTHSLIPAAYAPPSDNTHMTEPQTFAHMRYMSGNRGDLLRALVDHGILDPFGKITPEYANTTLPPLTEEDLALLTSELERPFTLTIDKGHTLEITMGKILRNFVSTMIDVRSDLYIRSSCLIGSYVSYLLFSQTDYSRRVFQALKIESLYNEELFPKAEQPPADIDLRMHVEVNPYLHLPEPFPLERKDLEQLRDLVITQLSDLLGSEVSKEEVHNQVFSDLCTIDGGFLLMQLLSLKQSPVDWIIFSKIPRDCVFTIDDLYLPLRFFLSPWSDNPVAPESHRGQPLESFFHYVLGFTDAENIETIDEKGWFRYLTWITKGNCCIHRPSDPSDPHLEPSLFSTMESVWIRSSSTPVEQIREKLQKWLKKHHPQDSSAALALTLNTCLHLRGRYCDADIKKILLSTLPQEDPFTKLLNESLHQTSFETVCSILKIAALKGYAQKNGVEIRTDSFQRPVMHLRINRHFIQLDLEIAEALDELNQMAPCAQDVLARLFFHICSHSFLERDLENLGVDIDSSHSLIDNESAFIRYIGLTMLSLNPQVDAETKRKIAERNVPAFLKLAANKEGMRRELDHYIGLNTIPNPNSPHFLEKWVEIVFEYGRNSEQTAFELWKSLPFSTHTFALIKKLAHHQPAYALRLCLNADLEKFPNEAFKCILSCGEIVEKMKSPTHEHKRLADWMEMQIPQLWNHDDFRKPKNQRLLSSSLKWYACRSQSQVIIQTGLERNYFCGAQKKACLRLILLPRLTEATDGLQAKEIFFEGEQDNIFTNEELLKFTLELYDRDSRFAKVLIQIAKIASPNLKQPQKIVELLLDALENHPTKIVGIEEAFDILHADIPTSLNRRLFIQCYRKQIKLSTSINKLWYETLQTWCCEENPDFEMIHKMVIEGEKRKFAHNDALIEVKLTLAENGVEAGFSFLQELIRFLPNRIDQKRFYETLAKHIMNHGIEGLNMLDRVVKRDATTSYYEIIFPSVFDLCIALQQEKETFQALLNWLSQTVFFNALAERSRYRGLVSTIIEAWIESGEISVEDLYKFLSKYPEDLRAVANETWIKLHRAIPDDQKVYYVSLYELLNQHQIVEEEGEVYFLFYATAMQVMVEGGLCPIILSTERHVRVCAAATNTDVVLLTHCCLLEAIKQSPSDVLGKEAIGEIYLLANKSLLASQSNTESTFDPSFLDGMKPEIDFNYITILLKKGLYDEARECLNVIKNAPHLPNYWNPSGILINALAAVPGGLFLEETMHFLESFKHEISLSSLDIQSLIDLFLTYPSKRGYQLASTLMRISIAERICKPEGESWKVITRIMHGLIEADEYEESSCLAKFIANYTHYFMQSVSKDLLLDALELRLRHWSRCKDNPEFALSLCSTLAETMNMLHMLHKLPNIEANHRIFTVIRWGLVGLSRINPIGFSELIDKYCDKIIVKKAGAFYATTTLALPIAQCLTVKRQLIEMLIAAVEPNHPYRETLIEKIHSCLKALREEDAFKEKTDVYRALFVAFQEAVKS